PTRRKADGTARLVTGDAVTEITRLKAEDGGPMDIAGATLAAAAMRAGLIEEYVTVTHPVLVGGGTPFFTNLDTWVHLTLVETRTFPDDVLLTRYETKRRVPQRVQWEAGADHRPATGEDRISSSPAASRARLRISVRPRWPFSVPP